MHKASDAIVEHWAATMAEHQRNADMSRDPLVKAAHLDLVDGYRRLIDSEMAAQALFAAAGKPNKKTD